MEARLATVSTPSYCVYDPAGNRATVAVQQSSVRYNSLCGCVADVDRIAERSSVLRSSAGSAGGAAHVKSNAGGACPLACAGHRWRA